MNLKKDLPGNDFGTALLHLWPFEVLLAVEFKKKPVAESVDGVVVLVSDLLFDEGCSSCLLEIVEVVLVKEGVQLG